MNKLSVVLVFSLFSFFAKAQPYIDILNLEYYHLPEKTDHVKDNEKADVRWLKASLQAPLKMKEDYFIINPFYEQYEFTSQGFSEKLYGIALPLTYLKQWKNPKWKTGVL